MAKVATSSLPWLSAPSYAHSLFAAPSPPCPSSGDDIITPRRVLATRGSEIFLARGTEVRCAELQDLKAHHPKFHAQAETVAAHAEYKTLGLPKIDFEIRQLEVSPDDLYLAIVGEFEVVVCVLPGVGFLKRAGKGRVVPVPHYHKVGRSTLNSEVGERVARVLWHPLACDGASLCVLTADAYLRVYDLALEKDITYELADQTLDLYALNGQKRHSGGFSADQETMIPASMCFVAGEVGWRPFTVYILMRGGDVYGLAPVVPSRWSASRAYLNQLSLEITAEVEALDEERTHTTQQRMAVRQQTKWINEVLNQEAKLKVSALESGRASTCFIRPESIGPAPVLQGPFLFQPAPLELSSDESYAACDISHVASAGGVGILGIVYSHGKVDICLELDPLPAKWAEKKRAVKPQDPSSLPVIASYETLDLEVPHNEDSEFTSWPVFVPDAHSAHLWFVQHNAGITGFSMKPWIPKLESFLDSADSDTDFERTLASSPRSQVQKFISGNPKPIDGTAVLYDAYVGYILLTAYPGGVSSLEFDELLPATTNEDEDDTFVLRPTPRLSPQAAITPLAHRPPPPPSSAASQAPKKQPLSVLYPAYTPHPSFTQPSQLPSLLSRYPAPNSPITFSPQSSDFLRLARDTLKTEYTTIMSGAQLLHDRAAAQRIEYHKQLRTLHQISKKLTELSNKRVAERLSKFLERQAQMEKRADEVLRALVMRGERGLSNAEKKWGKEVGKVQGRVGTMEKRLEDVGDLVEELEKAGANDDGKAVVDHRDVVPEGVRERGIKGLWTLLERETLLVNATKRRLEKLEVEVERMA